MIGEAFGEGGGRGHEESGGGEDGSEEEGGSRAGEVNVVDSGVETPSCM